jgi:hypothetical protein
MSFNLEKYLTENNLTIISKIRKEAEDDIEPSKTDLKKSEKDFRGLDKKKKELQNLQAQVKSILAKYTERDANGILKLKDVGGYKKAVGNIPDRIKLLKQQIDQVENPKLDSDEEDSI